MSEDAESYNAALLSTIQSIRQLFDAAGLDEIDALLVCENLLTNIVQRLHGSDGEEQAKTLALFVEHVQRNLKEEAGHAARH